MSAVDKIVLTITPAAYSVEGFCGPESITSRTTEVCDFPQDVAHNGDDLFSALPVGVAIALDDMELMLIDIAIDLIPGVDA